MIKTIMNTEIHNVELKPGQVICMFDTKTKTHHNMIVFPCKDGLCAIEELFSTDPVIVDRETTANYCHLNRQKYPQTLGVSPDFGDTVVEIYPHMGYWWGYCCEDEEKIVITYYNEDGILCSRSNLR